MARREFRDRVGDRIKVRRTAAGLSQSELARKLPGDRIEGGQVSRWERGEMFPTYANLLALARALGCSEELLLCGCGEEHPKQSQRRRKTPATGEDDVELPRRAARVVDPRVHLTAGIPAHDSGRLAVDWRIQSTELFYEFGF